MKHVNAFESEDKNEYRKKREKNNESVRKSRAKNRVKIQECAKVGTSYRKQLIRWKQEVFEVSFWNIFCVLVEIK
jgi:hypothetical protein